MSHTTEPVEIYHEEYVRKFTPRNLNRHRLDPRNPITIGVIASLIGTTKLSTRQLRRSRIRGA